MPQTISMFRSPRLFIIRAFFHFQPGLSVENAKSHHDYQTVTEHAHDTNHEVAMGLSAVVLEDITFAYDSSETLLFEELSVTIPHGWTGVVGGNGTGKTTLLKLATGVLPADCGIIKGPEHAVYCHQDTERVPDLFEEFLASGDKAAGRLCSMLELGYDWAYRWDTLSHGERKRAQVATALWGQPHLLAVDEPTNHLDSRARELLFRALRSFDGIGLLVSHDRDLLDNLCDRCLFIDPPDVRMRPGNYSRGSRQAGLEEKTAEKERETAGQALKKIKREAARRRSNACHADSKRSKRGLAAKDHDAKSKIDLSRLSGKDGMEGRALKRLGGRIRQAEENIQGMRVIKRYETGIWLPGTRSKQDQLFHLPKGEIALSPEKTLIVPDLRMGPSDRIGVTGGNGTGKSSLIRHVLSRVGLPEERVIFLPQEVSETQANRVLSGVRSLPEEERGHIMTLVSRLGSRPGRLLETLKPSPGEVRKLLIALGIRKKPHLIIMDEPTNHLDLPSVECLEEALQNCPCGLLVVSHDHRFLHRIAATEWHLAEHGDEKGLITLTVA